MTDSLFDIPETKSPRLLWMEKHGIETAKGNFERPSDKSRHEWIAWSNTEIKSTGWGETEDEAITQLALKLGIKLWNEETCNQCHGSGIIDRPAMPDQPLPRFGDCPKCKVREGSK